jgi:uncharacterized membrane protein YkoI
MKTAFFAAALLLAAALAPTGASANVSEMSTATHEQDETAVDSDTIDVRRLLAQFRAAELSLSQAMTIAEDLHKSSRTARVSFEGSAGYRVRTVRNDTVWDNTIDAATGRATGQETVSSLNQLSEEDRSNIRALRFVKQELSDAVAVAEKAAAGKAIGGGLMIDGRKLSFVVVVVSEDQLKQVMLEPPRIARGGKPH